MRFASMGLGIVLLVIALALLVQGSYTEIEGALIVAGVLAFSAGCLGCDIIEAAAVKREPDRMAKQLSETRQVAAKASAGPQGDL
jgi:hypothetical protein